MDDSLDPQALARPGEKIGHTVIVKQVTGSTNDDAKELAQGGADHGTVVIAEEQTRGRGRMSRTWHSPSGVNLILSVVLRPGLAADRTGLITVVTGVAVARTVSKVSGLKARIKWPNDVKIKHRKLAGILAEAGGNHGIDYVVLGIGLNVNLESADLPDEIRNTATSILMETGKPADRAEVFNALAGELERVLALVEDGKSSLVLVEWKELSETMGRKVRADTPAGVIKGTAADVREDGALVIQDERGEERIIVAGDVEVIQDASGY